MRLNKTTDYAIRAAIYLAKEDREVNSSDISNALQIGREFAQKVMRKLCKGGITGSGKGKAGGYHLIKPPSEITLADIARLTEFQQSKLESVMKSDKTLAEIYQWIESAADREMQKTTIKDLL